MNVDEPARSVIWIASYPKSGNTWVQSVVRAAGRHFNFPRGDLDVYRLLAEGRTPQPVRGVRRTVTLQPATVLKTHDRFRAQGLHTSLGLETAGFVYVMRNPLDMLLSYINFTRQQYENERLQTSGEYQHQLFIDLLGFDRAFSVDEWREMRLEDLPRAHLDHALRRFGELDTALPTMTGVTGGTWLEHCESWKQASATLPSIVLRYEDLLADDRHFLKLQRIFQFRPERILQALAEINEKQRSMQGKKVFYNKMTSYYYTEFFSPDEVQRFLARFEPRLKALGYGNLYRPTPGAAVDAAPARPARPVRPVRPAAPAKTAAQAKAAAPGKPGAPGKPAAPAKPAAPRVRKPRPTEPAAD